MGTPADKLSYLMDTKDAIRIAIEGKGQEITDSDTFRSYADKIGAISTSDEDPPIISISTSGKVRAISSGGITDTTLDSKYDSDFVEANIKSGVEIFGVTGSYAPKIETDCATWSSSTNTCTFTTAYSIDRLCYFHATFNSTSYINVTLIWLANKDSAYFIVPSSDGTTNYCTSRSATTDIADKSVVVTTPSGIVIGNEVFTLKSSFIMYL